MRSWASQEPGVLCERRIVVRLMSRGVGAVVASCVSALLACGSERESASPTPAPTIPGTATSIASSSLVLTTGSTMWTESSTSTPPACPDPRAAAEHVEGFLATYDYQGSASPAQLAEAAQVVATGSVTDAGFDGDGPWLELGGVTAVVGDSPQAPLRVQIEDGFGRTDFERELLVGLRVMAFLVEGRQVLLEGLWFACSDSEPAVPAKLGPGGEGWPLEPSIGQLVDLTVTPPALVDGPVVRRSGQREPTESSLRYGEPSVEVSGTLELTQDCLFLQTPTGRFVLVWPSATSWLASEQQVAVDGREAISIGAQLTVRGFDLPAVAAQYAIGTDPGAAVLACVPSSDLDQRMIVLTEL